MNLTASVRTTEKPRQSVFRIRCATAGDRQTIYHLRHDIYAHELGQHATNSPAYYSQQYTKTHSHREELKQGLQNLGLTVIPGMTNCVLAHLPKRGPDAANVVAACRKRGLFIRDARLMGTQLGEHTIRIAVKGSATNRKILNILADVLKRESISDRENAMTSACAGLLSLGPRSGSQLDKISH